METVAVPLGGRSYNIYIETGILSAVAQLLPEADKWFILTDDNVDRLYGRQLESRLTGLPYSMCVLPAGETSKCFAMVEKVIDEMATAGLTRSSGVLAFGGGVIGDLAGFCASIYMRGIAYVQLPTTLLAQVDSSVGGKTGIDIAAGKNMAGTFYQPQAVIIDTALLATLPVRDVLSGLGEVLKYAFICAPELGKALASVLPVTAGKSDLWTCIIKRCCELKAAVVADDEQEAGCRKILNFGHTIGHALEKVTGFGHYRHGEAVLLGMYYETLLARKMEIASEQLAAKIASLINQTGIELHLPRVTAGELTEAMAADKKNRNGRISFMLPVKSGEVTERMLDKGETMKLLEQILAGRCIPCGTNIILLGFMCSGKSTVARMAADLSSRVCYDVDAEVECEAGMSVAEIFKTYGETHFRALEKKVITRLSHCQGAIIACGGGSLLDADNTACLKASGCMIWLDASPETVYSRLQRQHGRPLAEGRSFEDICGLLKDRRQMYSAAADARITVEGRELIDIVHDVLEIARPFAACQQRLEADFRGND